MQFRKPTNVEQPTLYMDAPEQNAPVQESTPRRFNRFTTTGNPPVSQPTSVTPAPVPTPAANYTPQRNFSQPTGTKPATTAVSPPTGNMWSDTNKILKKFVNKPKNSPKGSAVEFSKAAFNLGKKDGANRYESLEGKMLMNFWTFDIQTNHQLDLIPTYMDLSEWLNVCHLITSNRLQELTAQARQQQQQTGSRYCRWIYQNNGGSHKPIYKVNGKPYGGDGPKAVSFKIIPGMRDNTWVLSSELYDGQTSGTGLIEIKPGSAPVLRIQNIFSYDDLVSIAEMSKAAIYARMAALATAQ